MHDGRTLLLVPVRAFRFKHICERGALESLHRDVVASGRLQDVQVLYDIRMRCFHRCLHQHFEHTALDRILLVHLADELLENYLYADVLLRSLMRRLSHRRKASLANGLPNAVQASEPEPKLGHHRPNARVAEAFLRY